MKNIFKVALLCAGVFTAAQSNAQTHQSVGHQINHTATKVGHKTAELASKGAADVTDKRYKNKWGPHGETIYIDKHAKYFYVDKRGHRVFLSKWQLKDKPYRH